MKRLCFVSLLFPADVGKSGIIMTIAHVETFVQMNGTHEREALKNWSSLYVKCTDLYEVSTKLSGPIFSKCIVKGLARVCTREWQINVFNVISNAKKVRKHNEK